VTLRTSTLNEPVKSEALIGFGAHPLQVQVGRDETTIERLRLSARSIGAIAVSLDGARIGLELERVALGPGIAADASDGQGLDGVVERLCYGRGRLLPVELDSAAQNERVGVVQAHPARRGQPQRLGDVHLR
jgi:hypothetical protein